MHQTELSAAGSTPSFREERQLPFDWDARVPVSTRCAAALTFMQRVLRERGAAGQPLWPTPASTMLGAFYAGRTLAAQVLVISLFADDAGWRMAARLQPGAPALRLGRPWQETLEGCWASWMAPLPPPGDPGLDVVRHALAAVAALRAAHLGGLVQGRSILFRGPCPEALRGLQHGDFRRPAVQDAAMLLGAACLELGLPPPLFVPRVLPGAGSASGPDRDPPDVDWDASSPLLRSFLHELAGTAGARLTLDVFASATSSLTARYYSADADPRAEGRDAFAQPDWGSSMCPLCHCRHQEFVVLTPPHAAVARALRKAQCDEVTGIVVVPYQITAPWWPLVTGASRTPSPPGARAFSPCIRWRARRALLNPTGAHLREVAICVFDFRPEHGRTLAATCPGTLAWRGASCVAADDDLDDDRAFAQTL
jgi:hypothetical protein